LIEAIEAIEAIKAIKALKEYRLSNHLTRQQLAEQMKKEDAEYSWRTIEKWEQEIRNPNHRSIRDIEKFLKRKTVNKQK